jgi:Oxidoreductase family, NAD-binding Rossmann fold
VWPESPETPAAVGRPLVVGLLGATGIARRAMVEPARRVGGVAVRAVAATDPERAAAFARDHGVPVAHPSYEALLADPAVDVAYLSMHSGAHARWAVAAAEAGKHVVVVGDAIGSVVTTRGPRPTPWELGVHLRVRRAADGGLVGRLGYDANELTESSARSVLAAWVAHVQDMLASP